MDGSMGSVRVCRTAAVVLLVSLLDSRSFAASVKLLVVEDPKLQMTKRGGTSEMKPGAWDWMRNKQFPALETVMDELKKQMPSSAHFEVVKSSKEAEKRLKQDAASAAEGFVIVAVPKYILTMNTHGRTEPGYEYKMYRGGTRVGGGTVPSTRVYSHVYTCEMVIKIQAYRLAKKGSKGKRSSKTRSQSVVAGGKVQDRASGKTAVQEALAIVMDRLKQDEGWVKFLEKLGGE